MSDLQSEQLAEKLSREDERPEVASPVKPEVAASPVAAVVVATDVDADLALALALQQQFDREAQEAEQLQQSRRRRPANTKVLLDTDREIKPIPESFLLYSALPPSGEAVNEDEEEAAAAAVIPAASNSSNNNNNNNSNVPVADEEDDDDYNEDDDEDDYDGEDAHGSEEFYGEDYVSSGEFEENEVACVAPDAAPSVTSVASSSPKQGGAEQLSRKNYFAATHAIEVNWKSKHDAELCGQRNTEYMEETHPQHSLGDLSGDQVKLSNPVFNEMMTHAERSQSRMVRKKFGKSEQATREQVMDPKTRMQLYKLINASILSDVHGVVSTGKEAAVYHAVAGKAEEGAGEGHEYAVKIFKTTLNEFKARAKYVEGEHRFRHQLNRQNPRKIIRLWAEKEMRNLTRAQKAGMRCPKPVLLRRHILIMDFIGEDGVPAPKLVEADLSKRKTLLSAYEQCVHMMRQLYHDCHLVHADLSEYNMLFYKKQLWFIDLAQGVEHEHPNAMRFLRDDCQHVTQFFKGRGLTDALSVRRLFEFVRATEAGDLAGLMAEASNLTRSADENADDDVWFNAFLPRSLGDMPDPLLKSDANRDCFHDDLLADLPSSSSDEGEAQQQEGEGEEQDEDAQLANQNRNNNDTPVPLGPKKNAKQVKSKEERRAAKKAVKAANRAKRDKKYA